MPTTLLRISVPMTPGPQTIQMPGGITIVAVDALGFLVVLPDGISLPNEPRKFEILDPGSDLADPDFSKYVYIGAIGAAGRQVFERALD